MNFTTTTVKIPLGGFEKTLLTDNNHLFTRPEFILDIYKTAPAQLESTPDKVLIESWIEGASSEVAIHLGDDFFLWELIADYKKRKETFEKYPFITDYKFGYVHGTLSPFGPNTRGMSSNTNKSGYMMWEEFIHATPIL